MPHTNRGHLHFSPPASEEQRQLIRALGGNPPAYLTPTQATKAISALRWRRRQRIRVATHVAVLAR